MLFKKVAVFKLMLYAAMLIWHHLLNTKGLRRLMRMFSLSYQFLSTRLLGVMFLHVFPTWKSCPQLQKIRENGALSDQLWWTISSCFTCTKIVSSSIARRFCWKLESDNSWYYIRRYRNKIFTNTNSFTLSPCSMFLALTRL